MRMGLPVSALEEIYHSPGEPGITLRVLRPASGPTEDETRESEDTDTVIVVVEDTDESRPVSDRYAELTLAGVVDYVGVRRERPVVSKLPNVPVIEDKPPVWLVRDPRGPVHRYLVPATSNGEPYLGPSRAGDNYAVGDYQFGRMVGDGYGAVPIHDRPGKPVERNTWGL